MTIQVKDATALSLMELLDEGKGLAIIGLVLAVTFPIAGPGRRTRKRQRYPVPVTEDAIADYALNYAE